MAFFSTGRRKLVSLPYDLPAKGLGAFALYAPSSALGRRAAVQANLKDDAQSRPAAADRKPFGLLVGTVHEVEHYARQEGAAWLADMARDICCPRGGGGVLWAYDRVVAGWRRVGTDEPITDTSYLYEPPAGMPVGLQTLYQRTAAASSHAYRGNKTLLSRLAARDGCCWITRDPAPLDAARILPEDSPLAEQQRVLDEFALPGDAAAAPLTSVKDTRLKILLSHGLERYFERFWLGFRRTGKDAYECHSFVDEAGFALTEHGTLSEFPFGAAPLVHGLPAAPPNPEAGGLPPAALFRWHYLQCVLKRFGHDDYFGMPGIRIPAADGIGNEHEDEFDWGTHLRRLLAIKLKTF